MCSVLYGGHVKGCQSTPTVPRPKSPLTRRMRLAGIVSGSFVAAVAIASYGVIRAKIELVRLGTRRAQLPQGVNTGSNPTTLSSIQQYNQMLVRRGQDHEIRIDARHPAQSWASLVKGNGSRKRLLLIRCLLIDVLVMSSARSTCCHYFDQPHHFGDLAPCGAHGTGGC